LKNRKGWTQQFTIEREKQIQERIMSEKKCTKTATRGSGEVLFAILMGCTAIISIRYALLIGKALLENMS
jgi:hypothetical protein